MYRYTKRVFDVIMASVGFVFFLPLFLIISLLIKMESNGPVFFIQKRLGEKETYFNIYKFRSMKVGTPNLATDRLGDPGIYFTTVGRFLRKSSLDELPQLINIMRGDMSVVGPRPALYNQYKLIEARRGRGINSIKPGLTGYAQIKGRDFITDEKKLEYDEYYLNHMSLALDIRIIVQTFFNVIRSKDIKDTGSVTTDGNLKNQHFSV